MTVAATVLVSNGTPTNGTSATTASFNSTAGRPILACICNYLATPTTVPTFSAHGLTWTQRVTIETDGGTVRRRITVLDAYPTGAGSGTATIDCGAVSQEGFSWQIVEFTGADTTDILAQAAATAVGNATGTVSATLGATTAGNATLGFSIINGSTAINAGAGYTGIADFQDTDAGAPTRLITEFRNDNTSTVDVSIAGGTARRYIVVGLELKAAAVAATGPGRRLPLLGAG